MFGILKKDFDIQTTVRYNILTNNSSGTFIRYYKRYSYNLEFHVRESKKRSVKVMRMGNEYAVERTMGRTESGKCQSKTHKTYRGTLTLWIAAFIMIAGLSIALRSNLVSAHDKS